MGRRRHHAYISDQDIESLKTITASYTTRVEPYVGQPLTKKEVKDIFKTLHFAYMYDAAIGIYVKNGLLKFDKENKLYYFNVQRLLPPNVLLSNIIRECINEVDAAQFRHTAGKPNLEQAVKTLKEHGYVAFVDEDFSGIKNYLVSKGIKVTMKILQEVEIQNSE